mmetsp:Transcript_452/g.1242  ORF Transcript_452/g.1242 Transcript_452/m.1242 type:complete len:165 (+) Transcript_452:119-613(+)
MFRSSLLLIAASLCLTQQVDGLAAAVNEKFKPKYGGGAGVGRLNLKDDALKYQTHYDMVLVERLQKRKSPQETGEGDLYVPDEDLPRLHLCRVLSIGPGREEENGMVAPDLDGIKPGDLIIAKDPWGIGPKDEELSDGTKLSYMRSMNIAAKLTGDLVPEKKEN